MATTTDLDAILGKIRKLKAMALGGATQGEIDNATTLIQRLMLEHNIEEAHLAMDAGEPLTGYGYQVVKENGARWRAVLMHAIALGHQCRSISDPGNGLMVFGHRDAVRVAMALYNELAGALEVMARETYGQEQPWDSARGWCNTYRTAAAVEINRRYREQIEAAKAEARSSTALTVIDNQVAATIAKAGIQTKKSAAPKFRGNLDAYYAGKIAGSRMPLGYSPKLA